MTTQSTVTVPSASDIAEKQYIAEVIQDEHCDNNDCLTCGGKTFYIVNVFEKNNESKIILTSEHYTPISSQKVLNEILEQFRNELKIQRFIKVIR